MQHEIKSKLDRVHAVVHSHVDKILKNSFCEYTLEDIFSQLQDENGNISNKCPENEFSKFLWSDIRLALGYTNGDITEAAMLQGSITRNKDALKLMQVLSDAILYLFPRSEWKGVDAWQGLL